MRQMNLKEAVEWINNCLTDEYRIKCYWFWEQHLGEAFVKQVKNRVKNK